MGDIIPGSILVRNIDMGVDPQDTNYRLLRNLDQKINLRCRMDCVLSSALDAADSERRGFYVPTALSCDGKLWRPLTSSDPKYVCKGTVVTGVVLEKRINEDGIYGKEIWLAHSKVFFEYKLTVHIEPQDLQEGKLCQALIYRLWRQGTNRRHGQKRIDANFLGYCGDNIVEENLDKTDQIFCSDEKMWWKQLESISSKKLNQISSSFENAVTNGRPY